MYVHVPISVHICMINFGRDHRECYILPIVTAACDCNPTGSAACDHQTGHCLCLPNVEGTHCDKCFPGYFDFNSESGCTPCNCNLEGSIDSQCHPDTGQCNCKQGVTGSLCDQCLPGFFRLSEDGCQGKYFVELGDGGTPTYS